MITNCFTFVMQLCIFEMISAISFYFDSNPSWGSISLLVLVCEYVAKGITLSMFIHKYNIPYSRKNMSLAILNQAIPLLTKYSKRDIPQHESKHLKSIENVDLSPKSRNYLRVATLVQVMREFVLVFLSVYILAHTFGIESICIPSSFDSSEWSTSTTFELKTVDQSLAAKLERWFHHPSSSNCECKRWELGTDFCFPNSRVGTN